jgi:hypothetical protein
VGDETGQEPEQVTGTGRMFWKQSVVEFSSLTRIVVITSSKASSLWMCFPESNYLFDFAASEKTCSFSPVNFYNSQVRIQTKDWTTQK